MSPLCREISGDDTKIQVDIYRGEDDSGWVLEREGIRAFLENAPGMEH
jgi:hypothetical protein